VPSSFDNAVDPSCIAASNLNSWIAISSCQPVSLLRKHQFAKISDLLQIVQLSQYTRNTVDHSFALSGSLASSACLAIPSIRSSKANCFESSSFDLRLVEYLIHRWFTDSFYLISL